MNRCGGALIARVSTLWDFDVRSLWRAGIPAVTLLLAATAAAEEPLGEVQSLIAAGDRAAARAQLDSLLAAESEDAPAREESEFLRAVLEPDGAEYEHRLRALLDRELAPARRASVYLGLGQIAFVRGDLQLALKDFRNAREAGKEDEGSLWEGLTAMALGDGEAARSALEKARNAESRAVRQRALIALGDAHRAGGEWSAARDRYAAAAEVGEPGSGWWSSAVYLQAECLQELDEGDRAKELLQLLMETTPDAYEVPLARTLLAALGGPPVAEETEPSDEAPEGDGVFYTIQVGAFGQNDNAEALAARVRDHGFTSVRVVEGSDGLYRVFLGRYPDREQAESLGDSLGADLGLGFSVVKGN